VIISSAIIPRFKANDFSGGIDRGVDGIISVLTTDAAEWHRKVDVRADDPSAEINALFPLLFFALMIFIVWYSARHANRGPSGRLVRRGGRTVFIPYGGSWGSGWGGGFSNGGGFGGGFSGGGGSSGGGGASGSW
jgi:uncharacterized protein